MTPRSPLACALLLAMLGGCTSAVDDSADNGSSTALEFPGQNAGKSDVFGRALIGPAAPYVAHPEIIERQASMRADVKFRRESGWAIARHVLEPVALLGLNGNATASRNDPIEIEGGMPTVPRWQTWYGVDDFKRLFRRLYDNLGAEGRLNRADISDAALEAAFEWNAAAVDRSQRWPLDRYLDHVKRLRICDENVSADACARSLQSNFSGAANGNARIVYSPGAMGHLLKEYDAQLDCINDLKYLQMHAQPESPSENFTFCFRQEFPYDAALIKAHWVRADFGRKMPVYDTDADSLAKVIGEGKSAHWADGDRDADPGPDRIFTIRTRNGDTYRLAGLHIMTKELRHWVWVTLWWSDTPDSDFGEDRPADFAATVDPVWSNYKMAIVTDYVEYDEDPATALAEYPSLAATFDVLNDGLTWASNPYIEHGRGNARTNCIGCHQHGGATVGFDVDDEFGLDDLEPEHVIENERFYPSNGRTKQRFVFPADYLWSTQRVDNLRHVIRSEVRHFDRVDANSPEARSMDIENTRGDEDEGAYTFRSHCASCHGRDGTGTDIAPNLLNRVPEFTYRELALTLMKGKGGMPSWSHFTDFELASLIDYLYDTFGELD